MRLKGTGWADAIFSPSENSRRSEFNMYPEREMKGYSIRKQSGLGSSEYQYSRRHSLSASYAVALFTTFKFKAIQYVVLKIRFHRVPLKTQY